MTFDRLATVELQLILQCCEQTSWLRLARCSRFTLQAASQPFAKRYLTPLYLAFSHPYASDAVPYSRGLWAALKQKLKLGWSPKPRSLAERLQRSRLLRGCMLAVTLPVRRSISQRHDSRLSAHLSAVHRLCGVSHLWIRHHEHFPEKWPLRYFPPDAPLMRNLQVLVLSACMPGTSEVLRALSKYARRLHTVHVLSANLPSEWHPPLQPRSQEPQPDSAAIDFARVTANDGLPDLSAVDFAAITQTEERRLRRLELWEAHPSDLHAAFYSSSLLGSVCVLVLHSCWNYNSTPTDRWCRWLSSFSNLHSLQMSTSPHSSGVDPSPLRLVGHLLQALVACPHSALRQLLLHVPHAADYATSFRAPDAPAASFSRVLQLHPLLCTELRAPQFHRCSNSHEQLWRMELTYWDREELQLRRLAELMPQRFRFTNIASARDCQRG